MDNRYSSEIEMTFEEYKKMAHAFIKQRMYSVMTIEALLLAFIAYAQFKRNQIIAGIIFIVLIFSLPLLFNILYDRQLKKVYKNYKDIDKLNKYDFYDDYLTISQNDKVVIRAEYSEIFKSIETKDYFYFMNKNNQAFAVDKRKCSKELIDFIKGKIK